MFKFRPDNADFRLTKLGYEVGAISSHRYSKFSQTYQHFLDCKQKLEKLEYSFFKWNQMFALSTKINCRPKGFY